MKKSEDIVVPFIEKTISEWLATDWELLKSCHSNSKGARFKKVRELIERCDQVLAPDLVLWCKSMPPLKWTAKNKKSGQKTWCLVNGRKQSEAPTGEVAIERKLVLQPNEAWWAQIPTSSGFNVRGATKRSIDLVHKIRKHEFRFIELKINPRTNNPIYAAIELIEYGIFYSLIRSNMALRCKLHKESAVLLDASAVEFSVYAPRNYYEASLGKDSFTKLAIFGDNISSAFARLGGDTVKLTFSFRVFDETDPLRIDSLQQSFKDADVLGS